VVRISCTIKDTFSAILQLEASPVEVQQLQQKDKKRRKRKGGKKKTSPKTQVTFLSKNLKILISAHA